MTSVSQMLARMAADKEIAEATPLLDEALLVVDRNDLTHEEKRKRLQTLNSEASGYEQSCISDVMSSFVVSEK
ncbi:hypothetical protein tloyanaT_26180 [Thalassotalea loyana]|uniref:Uncharacterized protein n=1 Tax=Thalassotalea loyana TaxID=280483 RepID=A0ABQ6HHT7_9GAMM|nr:hypothetical protein [Thalassotalea loyana]GLX86365.1 hypothetical protein tloyanaT_26180 [Thalassotalea loyana]